jgi:hypothetical protein
MPSSTSKRWFEPGTDPASRARSINSFSFRAEGVNFGVELRY